jgi:hypothetical protein
VVSVIRPHMKKVPVVSIEPGSATKSWWAGSGAGRGEVHRISVYCNLSQFARLSGRGSDGGGIVPGWSPRQSKRKTMRGRWPEEQQSEGWITKSPGLGRMPKCNVNSFKSAFPPSWLACCITTFICVYLICVWLGDVHPATTRLNRRSMRSSSQACVTGRFGITGPFSAWR